jgi:hypothetical protein
MGFIIRVFWKMSSSPRGQNGSFIRQEYLEGASDERKEGSKPMSLHSY